MEVNGVFQWQAKCVGKINFGEVTPIFMFAVGERLAAPETNGLIKTNPLSFRAREQCEAFANKRMRKRQVGVPMRASLLVSLPAPTRV